MTRRTTTFLCAAAGAIAFASGPDARVPSQSVEPRVIEVLARRYAFEPSRIDATVGEPLRLLVRSGDGPHGFEIRSFKISKELLRGAEPVVIEFTPNEAGQYPIVCSLFCGDGHDDMTGTLVVQAREERGRQ
jgi:cytochrome c oxidase subunit 2